MPPLPRRLRKHLSSDALLGAVRHGCEGLEVPQSPDARISTADALMSAFAMFSLKMPSLLTLDQNRHNPNLHSLYRIGCVPCDTRLREILDEVPPERLRPLYQDLFRRLQRGKVLERFVFWKGCYLLALDGTGYFSSSRIHCENCLQKADSRTGQVTYYHQLLGAAIVHPDHREVIPLAPEPIIKQDGQAKNDCERNAAKRLLARLRREHPHLPLIVVEDALSSNAPHIEELVRQRMHFLLGVKAGDHPYLFDRVLEAIDDDQTESWEGKSLTQPGVTWSILVARDLPLNASHPEVRVNFLDYWEYNAQGEETRRFTWVTDLPAGRDNGSLFTRGGRARWRIENETFNTLKNQGYHFEHNFGHGYRHLSVVFATIMMLAFLVDQIQQACCPVFQAAWACCRSKRALWEELRSHFRHFRFASLRLLYATIAAQAAHGLEPPALDTS